MLRKKNLVSRCNVKCILTRALQKSNTYMVSYVSKCRMRRHLLNQVPIVTTLERDCHSTKNGSHGNDTKSARPRDGVHDGSVVFRAP